MPNYSARCGECGTEQVVFRSIAERDEPKEECEGCGLVGYIYRRMDKPMIETTWEGSHNSEYNKRGPRT